MQPAGQRAILDAARHEFAGRGYGAASIRDIARRAGVSLSAMYHYYSGKQELLHALLHESSTQYFASCDQELARAGGDAGERLAALVRATVRYRAERRLESSLLLTEWRHLSEDRLKEARQRQYDAGWILATLRNFRRLDHHRDERIARLTARIFNRQGAVP